LVHAELYAIVGACCVEGDIIEAVDGKRVDDNTEISLNVRKKTINDSLTMTINIYGRRSEVPIQLQARPYVFIILLLQLNLYQ